MKIFPVAGRLVRDPVTQRAIDAVGADVDPNDFYWARMLADGDVIAAPPEDSAAPPAPKIAPARSAPAQEA